MRLVGDNIEGPLIHDNNFVDEQPLRMHQEVLAGEDPVDIPLDSLRV